MDHDLRITDFRPSVARGEARGFTLLEVLIAMTLLGLVLGTVGIVLRVAVLASERAQRYASRGERERRTVDLLVHQIRSIRAPEAGASPFQASPSELDYETSLSLLSGAVGRFRVHLSVEETEDGQALRLVYRERPAGWIVKAEEEEEDVGQEAPAVILLEGLRRCEFSFLAKVSFLEPMEEDWLSDWDPAVQGKRLPAAVRWTVQAGEAGFSEDVVVPLLCSGVLTRALGP